MPSTATPLLELYEGQARAAAKVIESWREPPPDADQYARHIDDLIAEISTEFPRQIERMYHVEWGRAADGPIRECVPIGEALFGVWDGFVAVLQSVRDIAESLAAGGHTMPHLPDLRAAIDRLGRNRIKAHESWPWFRPEDVEAALAEHARGESLSLEDVFGALPRSHH
jgi:hypothetical protein